MNPTRNLTVKKNKEIANLNKPNNDIFSNNPAKNKEIEVLASQCTSGNQ